MEGVFLNMIGYYLHVDLTNDLGVNKKVSYQIEELKKVADVKEIVLETNNYPLVKIRCIFPLIYSCRYNYEKALSQIDNPDFIYIRKNMFLDKYFIAFLSVIKSKYPNCKIIYEIPTFPYLREYFISLKLIPLIYKEIFYSFFCKKYVDRIVTYSLHDKIFNVKTIPIMNGINVASFQEKSPSMTDNVITMIAVSMCAPWHGYERIIRGLYEYRVNGGNRAIRLLFVGEGREVNKYKKLVQKYRLTNDVIFKGILNGEVLENIYNEADIGLGIFGMYKKNMDCSSALKTREYLCKGLPIVSGCKEDVLIKYPNNFYLELENNSSPVDISKIIDFYDNLFGPFNSYESKQNVIKRVRNFAQMFTNMEKTFFPVIAFLNEQ